MLLWTLFTYLHFLPAPHPHVSPTDPLLLQLLSLGLYRCCSFRPNSSQRSAWLIPSRSLLGCHLLRKTFSSRLPSRPVPTLLFPIAFSLTYDAFYTFTRLQILLALKCELHEGRGSCLLCFSLPPDPWHLGRCLEHHRHLF